MIVKVRFYIRCDIAVACAGLRKDAPSTGGTCESVSTRALLRATILLALLTTALDMQECLDSVSNVNSGCFVVRAKKLCVSFISQVFLNGDFLVSNKIYFLDLIITIIIDSCISR